MSIRIGIDVGGSTTKIVGFRDEKTLITPLIVKANDPVASTFGAFGKFTEQNKIAISDIGKILITGVGSAYIGDEIFGVKTKKVSEFDSIGRGGLYTSGLSEAIVVSLGTGTALVYANSDGRTEYLGGTGIGGGTIHGLSKKILSVSHIKDIIELTEGGDLSKIDLTVGDITKEDGVSDLPLNMTAANFGKLSDIAEKKDLALGIINLVFESVAMLAFFAARWKGTDNIVLTGNITDFDRAKEIYAGLTKLFPVKYIIPDNSQFSTVIGAALEKSKQ